MFVRLTRDGDGEFIAYGGIFSSVQKIIELEKKLDEFQKELNKQYAKFLSNVITTDILTREIDGNISVGYWYTYKSVADVHINRGPYFQELCLVNPVEIDEPA